MAKFYSSTFGAISGKHGNAVAVTRKDGTTYIRIYTKPSNPRTDKQQAHRAKFALSSKALVPFNPIFKETIGITNGISTARSYAFRNAIVGEYPNLSVDYEKLMFSFGALEKLHNASATCNDGVVTINWDFQKMYNCHGDDNVNLVVYNKDSNQAIHIKDVAQRSDKVNKIDVQDSWADSELYFWAYVTSDDNISDSVFVGRCNPYDIAAGSYEEDAEDVVDAHATTSEPDSIDEYAKYDLEANGAIMSIVLMICNLISLFKQIVLGSNIKYTVNALICSAIDRVGRIDNTDYESVLSANLLCYRRDIFGKMCGKYQNIFTPIGVPIVYPL